VEEAAGRAIGFDDASVIGGVGDVAACAAGHEELDARFAVLFEEQRLPAALGSAKSGHQTRGPGAGDYHVPLRRGHTCTSTEEGSQTHEEWLCLAFR
jgi:hypothetical protein